MKKPIVTLDGHHFVRGIKVGEEELADIRNEWTLSSSCFTRRRLVRVTTFENQAISQETDDQHSCLSFKQYLYVYGRPITREESVRAFPDLADNESVVKLALSKRILTGKPAQLVPAPSF